MSSLDDPASRLEVRLRFPPPAPLESLRGRSAQCRTDRIRRDLCTSSVEVSIHADGGLDGLVAEMLLDDRQRDAGSDHPRGTGMTEVVHAGRPRQTCLHGAVTGWPPAAVEELLGANGIASTVGEEEARRGKGNSLQRRGRQAVGA